MSILSHLFSPTPAVAQVVAQRYTLVRPLGLYTMALEVGAHRVMSRMVIKTCLKLALWLPIGWITWKLTDEVFNWSGAARSITRVVFSWFPNVKRSRYEVEADQMLTESDEPLEAICDEVVDAQGEVKERKARVHYKYARRVVELIKIQFPVVGLRRTTSDYMTIHHAVVRIMTKDKLLPSQIARLAPLATGMVFVPSTSEEVAQSVVQSSVVEERTTRYNATTIDHWVDWWLGYGRRVRYTRD